MNCKECGTECQSESRGSERAGTFRWIKVCWSCGWNNDPGANQRAAQHALKRAGVRYHGSARQQARERNQDSTSPIANVRTNTTPGPSTFIDECWSEHKWERQPGQWVCSACNKVAAETAPDKLPCPFCGASKPRSEFCCEGCRSDE